jgi:hypothetical protein
MRLKFRFTVLLLLVAACLSAHAEVGLVLAAKPNSHGTLVNEITGAGHSAVYLSRVCPETPTKLRLCEPGELGSVLQNYKDYKEDEPFEWNAVPLSIYLYGVEDLKQRPLVASPALRHVLQEQYRQARLQAICQTDRCVNDEWANWRDSVAAAFVREIYIFQVSSTQEQDEQFIREFNARANENRYSGFLNNCADFSKLVVNTYFPHSAHRNILNDVGMTSPKAIARSFTHYAERHPELNLRVIRVEQVPGSYKRSSDSHEGTEQAFRTKKWLIPIAIVGYHAVPVLAASYFLTGRFNPAKEMKEHPSEQAAELHARLIDAKRAGDNAKQEQLKDELKAERDRQVGTREQWQSYRERFDEVLRTAVAEGVVSDRAELRKTFREMEAHGRIYLDEDEQPWLELESDGKLLRAGLSPSNVLAPDSDPRLRLQLLLARTDDLLSAGSKHRELYTEFQGDWALLQQAERAVRSQASTGVIATKE